MKIQFINWQLEASGFAVNPNPQSTIAGTGRVVEAIGAN